jgi:hypothetical protein
MRYAPLALLAVITYLPHLARAQSFAPDTPEAGSVEEIAKATTETRFLSPWVAYLPPRTEPSRRAASCTVSRALRVSS